MMTKEEQMEEKILDSGLFSIIVTLFDTLILFLIWDNVLSDLYPSVFVQVSFIQVFLIRTFTKVLFNNNLYLLRFEKILKQIRDKK